MIKKIINISSNMGLRYILFRFFYLIKTKLGWHKIVFPVKFKTKNFTTLNNWKNNLPPFFFYGKEIQKLPKVEKEILVETFQEIQKGTYTFFNKTKIELGTENNWLVNPSTGYHYDIDKHWSEVQDFSKKAGDIKYVWEKARFSFLYDIIRYDYHFNDDQSKLVFKEIEDFINKNPINKGPNYKCSQEISLRVLNWTFALYYYKDSKNLNENLFQIIINNIYWQIHHVYNNINFSRISVRNNHAITETLLLFLSQKLFPFFPNVKKWSKKGKRWFEQEITYQIYPDGTFLQFSMNYHRTVVQLLTWSIQLAKLNNDEFISDVYDRAKKSLSFLDSCMDPISGELPNYGSNDGALFFKLTDSDYRNYQSQLDDLRAVLFGFVKKNSESQQWYGLKDLKVLNKSNEGVFSFKDGGYQIIQEADVKTFIRCGSYKDRPFQADNLHLDIWVNGINYFWDPGSFSYNTDAKTLNSFIGTSGHNTVNINEENQMLKGDRFIWYNWIKEAQSTITEKEDKFIFKGSILGFKHIGERKHIRTITKFKDKLEWLVEDEISPLRNDTMIQNWNINPEFSDQIEIKAFDLEKQLKKKKDFFWYSGYYGHKSKSLRISYKTNSSKIKTVLKILNN